MTGDNQVDWDRVRMGLDNALDVLDRWRGRPSDEVVVIEPPAPAPAYPAWLPWAAAASLALVAFNTFKKS